MKKIVLSLATVAAMSSFAVAGGDIAPAPVAQPDNSGFYFGIGYSAASADFDNFVVNGNSIDWTMDSDESAGMLVVGYKYNDWLGFEGRWTHFSMKADFTNVPILDNFDIKANNIGLYVKPQYSFGAFTVYGLLGYGWTDLEIDINGGNSSDTDGDFQWGVGASYALSSHTSFFIDYTQLHNGGEFSEEVGNSDFQMDGDIYSINVGLTYKF